MALRSTITDADRRVLLNTYGYAYVCAPQLRRLCFPAHKHGRGTRQHTKKLLDMGYLRRTRVKYPYQEGFCPIWYLTKEGAVYLAEYFNDDRYLDAFTDTPREARGEHWLALGDAHMALDAALQTNTSGEVAIRQWTNEWQPVQEAQPGGPKYKLQTKLNEQPPLSCNPDAGFVLEVTIEASAEPTVLRKVHYVEVDRGSRSSAPRTVAAQKTPGYAVLAERGLHRVHFPEANYESFSILLVTTNASRLRRLAAELDQRQTPHLWLLTTMEDLQRFPYEEVVYDTKLQQRALLKKVGQP